MSESGEDRPALEIEVTAAMIAAGLDAFASYDERVQPLEDGIAAVFRAMRAVELVESNNGASKGLPVRGL